MEYSEVYEYLAGQTVYTVHRLHNGHHAREYQYNEP